jgi:hypothetical protein
MHASLEQAIQDSFGKVAIMHDIAQGRQGFVGGEQHGPALKIAFVDDAIEHIRRIGRVRQVP